MFNALVSDQVAVVGRIKPDATTANTYTSGWISLATYGALLAVIMAGDLGSSATVDAKFQQAKDGAGTGAKDVTGKAITQMTQGGTDKSNKDALLNIRAEEIDRPGGFTHVRLSVTVATATSDLAAIILGINARYGPPTQGASVDQTVA
ncbi:MAG: hypothetical protein AB7I42_26655 [Bradyrhizobium sp.]|uniref:hypothetical protein n=1 Tax=Bradyrhizobium sp. TaxID=376 RepID=UPI003D0D34EB